MAPTSSRRTNQKPDKWASIAIGAIAACIAAYGALAIVTQYHVGQAKNGAIVERIGMSAVGIGLFLVGGGCLMASLVLPQRVRLPAIVLGSITMVIGIVGAVIG